MVDSTDEQIVRLLGQDARQNSEKLAKRLNLSSATIRRRLRKLFKGGLLRIVGVVDPAKFGLPLAAVIALDVSNERFESASEWLAKRTEIEWVSSTTGRYDIIAYGRFASTESLSNFLTNELTQIEGVRNSETFLCLDIKKGRFVPLTRP